MDEAGEVDGSSGVSGGEAAEVLELVEASLDLVAVPVGGGVVRDGDLAQRFDGINAMAPED